MKKKLFICAFFSILVFLSGCNMIKNSNTSTLETSDKTITSPTTVIESSTPSTDISSITSSVVLTVTYFLGEENIKTETYNYNDVITRPEDPTKEGYNFINWYDSTNFDNIFDFSKPITEDTKIYAKWEIKTYVITLNPVGGNVSPTTITLNDGDELSLPTPTKNDLTFLGWYKDQKYTEIWNNELITSDITLYAKWDEKIVSITDYSGYNEGIYVSFIPLPNTSLIDYLIKYKNASSTSYKTLDSELLREYDDYFRFDIVGIKTGYYDLNIYYDNDIVGSLSNIEVSKYDRSGYAHFNYTSGVGAYNDDGTLKSGALVVYVNENNKNTVTATIKNKKYTGLSAILQAQRNSSNPLVIRIVGQISAATWNPLSVSAYNTATSTTILGANGSYLELKNYTEEEIIEGGFNTLNVENYTKLNGLTNRIKYDSSKNEFDSYYNMLDITGAKNVTVEGIGDDAKIFQWGFTWKGDFESIEIRNLTFSDYTEDACSFEGSGSDSELTNMSSFISKRVWVHNNTFNKGINYWDVCQEQDKHDGDGATDFKRVAYVTISYNHYYKNHKTGLVGGSDTQMSAAFTFHHNYYEQNQARLPFAREANMHMYNNYYYASTGNNMQIYAGAYAFIENCYFENIKSTFIVASRNILTAAIKSYNNIYLNCSKYLSYTGSDGATIVTSRDEVVKNENVFGQTFDTNSAIFYYDTLNKKSNVEYMTTAEVAKDDCVKYAGAKTILGPLLPTNNSDNGDETEENKLYKRSFDFSDITYDSLVNDKYKITSNRTYDYLTVVSSENRAFEVGSPDNTASVSYKDANGVDVTANNFLKSGGKTDNSGRYIKIDMTGFEVNKTYNIEIYVRTGSNGNARYGYLRTSSVTGDSILTIIAPSTSAITKNEVTINAGNIYYITFDSNIHLIAINIIENE